jgi:two-component system chemotaxis sensor kinase CheA
MARLKVAAAGRLETEPVEPIEDSPLGRILVERGAATPEAVQWALDTQSEPQEPRKVGDLLRETSVVTGAQVAEALSMQEENPDRGRVGEILVEVGAVRSKDVEKALEKQMAGAPKMGELLVRTGQAAAKEVAQALRSQAVGESVQVKDLVKVDSDRLDRLVDLIGELVIAESMVSQASDLRQAMGAQSLRHINQVDKITRALQEMGTSLRMVPVRSTFQKMARLVRDVAKKAGKGVDFVTLGDDTELDKSVVDKIGDPLVHMIRNAVDHGLETPDERLRLGKPAMGRVELRAFHKGGGIYIEIEDDGRGLNREAILAKAVERGLIRENDNLSDREVWDLIFQPGFSTAKQITDVSGRGVGMDVVKRNIDALRGRVDVRSEWGVGTVISVRLPLTMAIIDGMVVGIGAERYVVPTLSIVRSIRPEPEQITTVAGRGELLNLDGSLLPIFRLSRLFQSEAAKNLTDGIVVVAENDGRQIGLAVDTLLGQQQIVIKPLGEGLKHAPGIVGGAVMPDGEVGLILDVAGLLTMANTGGTPSHALEAEG